MFDMVMPGFLRGLDRPPPCASSPDDWHPEGAGLDARQARKRAVAGCQGCPVMRECAAYAVDRPYLRAGVWGGLTAAERVRLRRERREAAAAA